MAAVDFLKMKGYGFYTPGEGKTSDSGLVTKKFVVTMPSSVPQDDTLFFGQLPLGAQVIAVMSRPTAAGTANANASLGAYPNTWITSNTATQVSDAGTGYDIDGLQAAIQVDGTAVLVTTGAKCGVPLDTTLFTDSGDAGMTHVLLGLNFDTAASGTAFVANIYVTYYLEPTS